MTCPPMASVGSSPPATRTGSRIQGILPRPRAPLVE